MSPDLLEVVAPLFALAGVASAILIGIKMRYTHIERARAPSDAERSAERLASATDALHDEIRLLRDEVQRLGERVDFAERLLERPKAGRSDSGALPGKSG
jgi:plasmid stabilization system protein ParE